MGVCQWYFIRLTTRTVDIYIWRKSGLLHLWDLSSATDFQWKIWLHIYNGYQHILCLARVPARYLACQVFQGIKNPKLEDWKPPFAWDKRKFIDDRKKWFPHTISRPNDFEAEIMSCGWRREEILTIFGIILIIFTYW